ADLHRAQADRRGRDEDRRSPRRVHGAAPGRVSRSRSVQPARTAVRHGQRDRQSEGVDNPEGRHPLQGRDRGGEYDVGEYDVSILAAQESDGLVNWLIDNGYRIPAGADQVLSSYIRQGMRFFVAKVNLDRMQLIGNKFLRPLQVRYQTAKFM